MGERDAFIEWRKSWDALAAFTGQLDVQTDLDALAALVKLSDDVTIKWRAVLNARATEAGW